MPPEFQEALASIKQEFELYHKMPEAPVRFPWQVFMELRPTKAYESPICHQDIKAWVDLYKVELAPWEIQCILVWDRLYYSLNKD